MASPPTQQAEHLIQSLEPQYARSDPPYGPAETITPDKQPSTKSNDSAPKRGYRACVHCRLRKAKCDLGDPNAPSSPPCGRCRREQRSCVFLPSKRRKRNGSSEKAEAEIYAPTQAVKTEQSLPHGNFWQSAIKTSPSDPNSQTLFPELPMNDPSWAMSGPSSTGRSFLDSLTDSNPSMLPQQPRNNADVTSAFTEPGIPSSSSHNSARSTKRRSPNATRRIIAADFANETDALEILANAATDGPNPANPKLAKPGWNTLSRNVGSIEDYCLVREHILSANEVTELITIYFERYHPALPIFQTARVPKSLAQMTELTITEPFLVSTFILVSSRHHPHPRMRIIHEKTWQTVRQALSDYSFRGLPASIGFIEGLLILAEFLPRQKTGVGLSAELLGGTGASGQEGVENRRSWALTGTAIRAGYGLGLDAMATDNTNDQSPEAIRARSTWTWCYLYDRTIGLRTGLAFWSRGPSLCFVGYSHISQTGEAAAKQNFPTMLETNKDVTGNDSASLMQALMELTQIMTNAHDILYPSKERTAKLVKNGTYFKYCDHFRKALESYDIVWRDKKWRNPVLKELALCTYCFVRLYVSSFAFQAHVQRAQTRSEQEGPSESGSQLFPRGSATSPDAPYIYESIDAADEILNICLRLSTMGALTYLPSRYLINFTYGGVFALKAGYSGATSTTSMLQTRNTVDRVCTAMISCSPDSDHPASRYGELLLLLAKKLEQLPDSSNVPTRRSSPEPIAFNNDISQLTENATLASNMWTMPFTDVANPFGADIDAVNLSLDGFWDDFLKIGE